MIQINLKIGDKLYMIMSATVPNKAIISTGNLVFNNCGPESPPSSHGIDIGTTIIPFIWDGENFYGLDYC
mgnify:CR=1 FL=1